MDLERLTLHHRHWLMHNFPNQTADEAFLGVVEEVGEISHALLKSKQKIREYNEDDSELFADLVDGVGDLVIFLDGFCISMGIDFASAVSKTWKKVSQRDWIAYPETGLPPKEE